MSAMPTVRFGTRGSALARAQTAFVIARFSSSHPEISSETVIIQTEGDRDKTSSLTVIGGRGVFTNALQDALRHGDIDAAVHSAKDLPTEAQPDLMIAAFLGRTDARDVLVSKHNRSLAALNPNPVIGTSSRRRAVQVLKLRPDARIVDLRGNIDTRLRKAFETELDGVVLAAAGIERMGWSDQITEYLPIEIAVPSPGQGALAIEIRAGESGPVSLLAELDDLDLSIAVKTERAFLRGTGGGCTSPVGAFASVEGDHVRLRAMLSLADGTRVDWIDERAPVVDAEMFARSRAMELLATLESPSSLKGKRILVTRGTKEDGLSTGLRARGAETIVAPVNQIERVDKRAIDLALKLWDGAHFDWIVFTSQNAVDGLADSQTGLRLIEGASVAAVGSATTRKLRERGIDVDVQPDVFSSEALVAELAKHDLSGRHVLFPHGNLARAMVPERLRALGAEVEAIEVYRTLSAETIDPNVVNDLSDGTVDAVVFCSPSSVHGLLDLLGEQSGHVKQTVVACIGPTTGDAARKARLPVLIQPNESTIESLIVSLEMHFAAEAAETQERVAASPSREGRLSG